MTWSGTQSLTTVAATKSAIWSSLQAPSLVLFKSQKTYSPGRISVIGLLVENSIVGVEPALTTSAVTPTSARLRTAVASAECWSCAARSRASRLEPPWPGYVKTPTGTRPRLRAASARSPATRGRRSRSAGAAVDFDHDLEPVRFVTHRVGESLDRRDVVDPDPQPGLLRRARGSASLFVPAGQTG